MNEQYQMLEFHVVKDAVAAYCAFSLGKAIIVEAKPMFDEWRIRRELARTREAYALITHCGNMPFFGIADIEEAVIAASKDRTLNERELVCIAKQSEVCRNIYRYIKESELDTPEIDELCTSLHMDDELSVAVSAAISHDCVLYDHASSALQRIRKEIRLCEGDIAKEVQRFISRHSALLMDTITTKRNDRICVLVKTSEKHSLKGFIHGESASGQTVYLEPEGLLLLNNRLQSLRSKEQEEVMRILFQLSQLVKKHRDTLLGNQETFALLDALCAKALWCKDVDGCIGSVLSKGNRLYIKNARHPLIDRKSVVANTYEIRDPKRLLIITGSNTGGKTVALKTMGLFAALTMAGMPVCAEEAVFPVFDQLFADIGDTQSIQESLSTFSAHISKLSYICAHATERSFVILDELGSGTDPKEGEALAVAILEALRKKGVMCAASTHYSALKKYGAMHEDVLLSSVVFDLEQMRPTYVYQEGISGSSNAFEIASRYGLSKDIIAYAKAFKEQQKSDSDRLMETMEHTIAEHQQLKEKMELRLADVKELQISLRRKEQELALQKDKELSKVKEEALREYMEKMEEAEAIIERLKAMHKDAKPHEYIRLKKELETVMEAPRDEERPTIHKFHKGDYVRLEEYGYHGDIIEISKDKAIVDVNGMKMKVPFTKLQPSQRTKKKKQTSSYQKTVVSSFSMELNVIGMRVGEAIPVIDKYLDNAVLAKVYQVRIIHGNGTGALRQGVHDYLKRNSRVESYRVGVQGEGGLGATVVTLKQKGKHHG